MIDLATLLATLPLGYAMALTALLAFLLAFGLAGWLAARRQRAEAARHEAALADLRVRLAEREKQLDDAKARLGEAQVSEARLATTLEQKQQHFEAQLALLRDSREQLRQEFENLANEILERKGRAFSELSQQRISGLLQPIQAEMKGFREKVETIHRHDTEQRAGLRAELRHLQALNREITDQAERLTQA
ncbi:MAG: DNA recombination protein RmuC, partial [Billgrantia desiderata]